MKIALVYDRVNKIGGAERVLLALHEIFPEAPLFTLVYNKKNANWAKVFPKIYTSFLQKIPLAKSNHEFFFWLAPIAFERFNFENFDVVISITSAEAKGIITGPNTLHLCYCLTPTRYLWHQFNDYRFKNILNFFLNKSRTWDQIAATRPDKFIAISKNVANRIKKYYRRDSLVIYPPVNINFWKNGKSQKSEFYLIVSRLVPYKKIHLAISAFNQLNLKLKIIGSGRELKRLKKMSKKNIEFLGQLTDKEILSYYQSCKAVIFCGNEDFGLVPLEAQACGKPVIACKIGGALETIKAGETGEFFWPQTVESLIKVLEKFEKKKYNQNSCRELAKKFDLDKFKRRFEKLVKEEWKNYKKSIITS